jgi:hypothetical protein
VTRSSIVQDQAKQLDDGFKLTQKAKKRLKGYWTRSVIEITVKDNKDQTHTEMVGSYGFAALNWKRAINKALKLQQELQEKGLLEKQQAATD